MDSPTVETVDTATATTRSSVKAVGTRLGRYTIVKLLGRGGVGAVYEADDPDLGRRVALKLLRDDRAGNTEGLRREAQALAKLVHQNVVMVYDVGVADGEVFLVMQLVEGMTIDQWLRERGAKPELVIEMFEQAGEGLVAAHEAGLVHCDFKPHNVLVDARGVARVGDFGLARMLRFTSTPVVDGERRTPAAGMTQIAGTPAYMAPEQFTGKVTAASDQFAFCVALWECLTGERPFEESSTTSPSLDASMRGARRPVRHDVKLPRHVLRAIERGMSEKPADRFSSMRALLDAFEPQRSRVRVGVIAGVGGVLVGGAIAVAAMHEPERASSWNGADVEKTEQLTMFGDACAYAPAFDRGGKRVVFDRTSGDAVDLYEVPREGGAPAQLTTSNTWEWRAQPGRREGEVVHLVHDLDAPAKSLVAFLDLDTKRSTPVVTDVTALDAAVAGDAIYYSPDSQAGIRVKQGKDDRTFLLPKPQHQYYLIAVSPTGKHLAVTMSTANIGAQRPCLVTIATKAVTCFPETSVGRPAFGVNGRALYYATHEGIVRRDLDANTSALAIPAYAEGGVAIAPDGSALVYSACKEHRSVVDVNTHATIIPDEPALAITMSPRGHIAFVRDEGGNRVLVLRTQDGHTKQLTDPQHGKVGHVDFDPTGRRIVFATGEPKPGLRIVDIERPGEVVQLTSDARDRLPAWTSTNYIGFTQGDTDGNDQAYAIRADGGPPKRLSPSTRTVYGSRGKQLLVGSVDALYWVDPETGEETPGPPLPLLETGRPKPILEVATSPSGNWVVMRVGVAGEELYRYNVDGPRPDLTRLHRYEAGVNVGPPAIGDDGHVIAPIGRYKGDLFRVPARPGMKF